MLTVQPSHEIGPRTTRASPVISFPRPPHRLLQHSTCTYTVPSLPCPIDLSLMLLVVCRQPHARLLCYRTDRANCGLSARWLAAAWTHPVLHSLVHVISGQLRDNRRVPWLSKGLPETSASLKNTYDSLRRVLAILQCMRRYNAVLRCSTRH